MQGNIERSDTQKIIIPANMGYDEAAKICQKEFLSEEREINFEGRIFGFPFDAAYAFTRAVENEFSFVFAEDTMTRFGPTPPSTREIKIGFGKTMQILWGSIFIPGVAGHFEMSPFHDHALGAKGSGVGIQGVTKRKFEDTLNKLMASAREIIRTGSIYKGNSIKLSCEKETGAITPQFEPEFIYSADANQDKLVFSKDIMAQVEAHIFSPIRKTEQCRMNGVPLKRGVILSGQYGTGKTLTAHVTAKICEDNNWTFINLPDVRGLADALSLAQTFAPSVLFAEDVDRIFDSPDRDHSMDEILNTIDGVVSKNDEVMVILTTNNVEKLHRAILRPGRIDGLIELKAPDAEAAERLLRLYGKGIIPEDIDISNAANALAGRIPALIGECVQRAKLFEIRKDKGEGMITLTEASLVEAAKSMEPYFSLAAQSQTTKVVTAGSMLDNHFGIVSKELGQVSKNVLKIADRVL